MSKVVALQHLGRFGNQLFGYAFARAYAEKHGFELQTDPWIGERVFNISHPRIAEPDKLTKRCENTLIDGEGDVMLRSYFQQQKCLIYRKCDCQKWFKFSNDIHHAMEWGIHCPETVAHRRAGDYTGYKYPTVSVKSYERAREEYGLDELHMVTEESPMVVKELRGELSHIPDFYTMVKAETLLRGNSSFSWWAATIGECEVYSPVMTNAIGGQDNDCLFVEGNCPAFRCDLEFITDLWLPE